MTEEENHGIGIDDADPNPSANAAIEGEDCGTLGDVHEQDTVPTSKRVLVHIGDVEIRNLTKEGNASNWRYLALSVKLVEGITIEDQVQFKDKNIFYNIPYYASPSHYDYSQPFFKNNQHMVALKNIIQAIEMDPLQIRLVKGGVTDEIAEVIANELTGKTLMVDIIERDEKQKNDEGKRVPTGRKENVLQNWQAASDESLV